MYHVNVIPASALPAILTALAERGVAVDHDATASNADEELYQCHRGRARTCFATCPEGTRPGVLSILLSQKLHSLRPWRWADEWRLWGDLAATFAHFDEKANA